MTPCPRVLLLLAALGLGACETSFNADIAADPLDNVSRVSLPLDGVVLQQQGSGTETVERRSTAIVDLIQFDGSDRFELLSGFEIGEGDYTGVRLLIDDTDAELQTEDGGEFPIELATTTVFAPVTFSLDEGDSARISLALDLRLSLAERDDERYVLSPVLRAVRGEGGTVTGSVAPALLTADNCVEGVAVYLYPGNDVEPQERDGSGTSPVATAPVRFDEVRDQFRYTLRFVPEGDYTAALTCDGEREDGIDPANPEMDFSDGRDLSVEPDRTTTLDF